MVGLHVENMARNHSKAAAIPIKGLMHSSHQRSLLHAPIWFSNLPALQIIETPISLAQPLASGPKAFVAFCFQVNRLGYRSLGDFLIVTAGEFTIHRFMHCLLSHHELRRFSGFSDFLQRIFQRASILIQSLACQGNGNLDFRLPPDSTAGLVGIPSATRFHFFPSLRKQDWTQLLRRTSPQWHARASHLNTPIDTLQAHSVQHHNVRRWMIPTSYDIQLRVLNELMPVNARRFFLQRDRLDPTICPHKGCYHVESLAHCFWNCTEVRQVWKLVRPLWSLMLDHAPSWTEFLLGGPELIHSRWSRHKELCHCLWLLLRGTFMRDVWLNRNRSTFGQPAFKARTVAAGARPKFIANLPSIRRCQRVLRINSADLRAVLGQLVSEAAGSLPSDLAGDAPGTSRTALWSLHRSA